LSWQKKTVKEIATDRKINITIDDISKAVCHYLNIAENKIREKTKERNRTSQTISDVLF
jgi:chromosomal replication initiation ATPase DnaA